MLFATLLVASASASSGPCNVSNVFGDHMVLQRAPQKAMVWGFAPAGTTVSTTFSGSMIKSVAGGDGTWRATLPATKMNNVGQNISFSCSTGEKFALADVLFGDVHICGGQSNMQFTLGCIGEQGGYDANAEIAKADSYPNIRTMTVGTSTTSYLPLTELKAMTLPWSVASTKSIGLGNWSATSAVCWYYAKDIYDKTQVPQGIVSSNWGGTIIQSWMDNATNAKCTVPNPETALLEPPQYVSTESVEGPEAYRAVGSSAAAVGQPGPNNGHGVLFNAMINPFTVGPMGVTSFIWFQGESNLGNPASYYACAQPAMVTQWRENFKNPTAFFGYVELEPWIGAGDDLAAFRTAQLLTNKLHNVGFAMGTDIGDPLGPFTSIHPRNKKLVGQRLAAAAMTMVYGTPTQYLPPTYKSAAAAAKGTALTVSVSFDNVPSKLTAAADHCKTELKVPASECAWFSIMGSDNVEYNATATVGADGKSVVLSAVANKTGVTATGSSFGMKAWPINTIMSAEGFPLQPWSFPVA